jgi:tetratricopeptide (TPR) repeat protein
MTVQRDLRSFRPRLAVLPLLISLGFALACGGTADSPDLVKDAEAKLQSGDLPGAKAEFEKVRQANPQSVYAAQGLAYELLLEGQYAEADKLLAEAEAFPKATEDAKVVGEIKLRRALVALSAARTNPDQLEGVKTHGKASGLPVGMLLAGEVLLADAESEEALKLLREAAKDPGMVGQTAQQYIDMAGADNPIDPGLAEATALWSLGQRETAVEAAEELLKALPEDRADASELQLLWAGRAVTSGRSAIAAGLLDVMGAPPEGQIWRVQATRAMIAIADGDAETGLGIFQSLATAGEGVPADGLSDALATAAGLTADPQIAAQLAGQVEGSAAARGLLKAGANPEAVQAARAGSFKQYLEGR